MCTAECRATQSCRCGPATLQSFNIGKTPVLDCAAYTCAAHPLDLQCLSLESDITSLTSIIMSPSYYAYQVNDCPERTLPRQATPPASLKALLHVQALERGWRTPLLRRALPGSQECKCSGGYALRTTVEGSSSQASVLGCVPVNAVNQTVSSPLP